MVTPDEPTRLKMFHANRGLAFMVAKRFGRRNAEEMVNAGWEQFDLDQEALQWLWTATEHYNAGLGFAFSTFAVRCIRNGLMGASRRWRECATPLQQFPVDPVGVPMEFAGAGPPADQIAEQRDEANHAKRQIRKLLRVLPPRERQILLDHFIRGRKYREIAAVHGITHQRIFQLATAGLKRLRAAVGRDA